MALNITNLFIILSLICLSNCFFKTKSTLKFEQPDVVTPPGTSCNNVDLTTIAPYISIARTGYMTISPNS